MPSSTLEKGIAAFPEEIPYRLIKLFSYKGETVLDPFLGSGTTIKVAKSLGRNSIGFEIIRDLEKVIRKKTGFDDLVHSENSDIFEVFERKEGKYRYVNHETIEKITLKNKK